MSNENPGRAMAVSLSEYLTVFILTYNERLNLGRALRSLAPLGARIVVVDSGSTDDTVTIAREGGCEVVEHPFSTQAEQLNWALGNVRVRTPWIMRIDADERLTSELAAELLLKIPNASSDVTGFEVKRRIYFWGRWIRHGGVYPTWLFRVWRHGTALCESRRMDEHMVSLRGRVCGLQNDIIDENRNGMSAWIDKHNRYASREVAEMCATAAADADAVVVGQARKRRWWKTQVYLRAPLFGRAIAYWLYRYVCRGGMLDGIPGFVFHFNQGLWYRLLVDAKLFECSMRQVSRGDNAVGGERVQ